MLRIRINLQDRWSPVDRGTKLREQPFGSGTKQGVGQSSPLSKQTFLDVLLMWGDDGTVIGAQRKYQLLTHVRLGEPMRPGRGSDDPDEGRDLAQDTLVGRRQKSFAPCVQSLYAFGGVKKSGK